SPAETLRPRANPSGESGEQQQTRDQDSPGLVDQPEHVAAGVETQRIFRGRRHFHRAGGLLLGTTNLGLTLGGPLSLAGVCRVGGDTPGKQQGRQNAENPSHRIPFGMWRYGAAASSGT